MGPPRIGSRCASGGGWARAGECVRKRIGRRATRADAVDRRGRRAPARKFPQNSRRRTTAAGRPRPVPIQRIGRLSASRNSRPRDDHSCPARRHRRFDGRAPPRREPATDWPVARGHVVARSDGGRRVFQANLQIQQCARRRVVRPLAYRPSQTGAQCTPRSSARLSHSFCQTADRSQRPSRNPPRYQSKPPANRQTRQRFQLSAESSVACRRRIRESTPLTYHIIADAEVA